MDENNQFIEHRNVKYVTRMNLIAKWREIKVRPIVFSDLNNADHLGVKILLWILSVSEEYIKLPGNR